MPSKAAVGAKPHVCEECGYATNRSYNLKVHMASHSNKRQHRCLHCDASFTTTSNLYRHELNQHKDLAPAAAVGATAVVEELPPPSTSASTAPPPPPPGSPPAYASSEAAGSLPSSPTAVARAASAPVTKRRKTTPTCTDFVCTQAPCNNKPFSNKANLQRHIENVHESLRRYPCPFTECSKAFKQRAHLQEHLGTHAPKELGKWMCGIDGCTRVFRNCGNLAKHTRTHTGERPFACDMCDDAFFQKHHLLDHRRSHLRPSLGAASAMAECEWELFDDHESWWDDEDGAGGTEGAAAAGAAPRTRGAAALPPPQLLKCRRCSKVLWSMQGWRNHENACGERQARRMEKQTQKATQKAQEQAQKRARRTAGPTLAQLLRNWAPANDAFTCDDCGQRFESAGELTMHGRTHAGDPAARSD